MGIVDGEVFLLRVTAWIIRNTSTYSSTWPTIELMLIVWARADHEVDCSIMLGEGFCSRVARG